MPGTSTAPRKGEELKQRVVELADTLGLRAETEVKAARRLWGAKRRIDVVLTQELTRKVLGIECKYQGTSGSAEEKIPATIKDIEYWPIPGIVVIDGPGFSDNMKGFLLATGKAVWFEDLHDWLKLYFVL
ncbi:MAG: PD-(D/E)XK nuclease superfamily protein [bacterium]